MGAMQIKLRLSLRLPRKLFVPLNNLAPFPYFSGATSLVRVLGGVHVRARERFGQR